MPHLHHAALGLSRTVFLHSDSHFHGFGLPAGMVVSSFQFIERHFGLARRQFSAWTVLDLGRDGIPNRCAGPSSCSPSTCCNICCS